MLDNIQTITTLAILSINIVLLIYNIIKSIIGKVKAKKMPIDEDDITKSENDKNIIEIIRNIIPQAIMQVEKSGIVGSDNKKLLALSQILLSCNAGDFDYKANAELINECLEELITFSKTVNAKGGGNND